MTTFLIRRFMQMLAVIFLSALTCYLLLNFAPGGPLSFLRERQQSGQNRVTEEDIARIRAYFELDLNIFVRFSRWFIGQPRGPLVIGGQTFFGDWVIGCRVPREEMVVTNSGDIEVKQTGCKENVTLQDLSARRSSNGVLFFDFGRSWKLLRDRPVTTLLASRVGLTLQLGLLAAGLALLVGVPLGIYSAIRQYSRFDYISTTVAFIGTSMPTFFFGVVLLICFSIFPKNAGWSYLPPGSPVAVRNYDVPLWGQTVTVEKGSTLDRALHLVLPVLTLTFISIAGWSRYMRSQMLEVLRQDYIRTARAKGLQERMVIFKHALRNALIPFVTIVVGILPG
jgi:peptide/nickel transport system permease protein